MDITVYLPDELGRAAKEAELPLSQLLRDAVAAQLDRRPEIRVDEVPRPYWQPTVTMPDGKVIECQHKYLHETEDRAWWCGHRIAAAGRFVK
jgi:hypothetical protein